MAVFLVLFAAMVALAPALHVVADDKQGFISIDCGLDKYSGYTDPDTSIFYVSDSTFVDAGENRVVAAATGGQGRRAPAIQTLRSFPTGARNCYALPTATGAKYLVRMQFAYGNYDGQNSSLVEFEIHLGSNEWDTVAVTLGDETTTKEAFFVAWASWAPVCLVNTGGGTPFVSVVELRPLKDALYPPVTTNQSMSMYKRINMGANTAVTRFPNDQFDRFWWPMETVKQQWTNLSSKASIKPEPSFNVSSPILQTAVEAGGNDSSLTVMTWQESKSYNFMVFLHFADFQSTQFRQFNVYLNDNWLGLSSPLFLAASCVYKSDWYRAPDGNYNITLAKTAASMQPPMLNALEIYTLIDLDDTPMTFSKDFDAIMDIKNEYGLMKKNWMGDPCFPTQYAWDGVKCSNRSDDAMRITSLDLSNSNLRGGISQNFSLLTALENLDLSYNNLSGSIPDSLLSLPSLQVLKLSGNNLNSPSPVSICKIHTGLHFVSDESDGHMCNKRKGHRATVVAVSVLVPVVVLATLVLAYFTWRHKRKPNVSTHDSARDAQFDNAPGSTKSKGDHLQNSENRRFTYKELENFTNNFRRFIGHGGFGLVYYGCLEDGTEVAVKMRSESSSHGIDEFLAEVQSLTKVHHRNLVSLVGYCQEEDHLALVYEYMSQGNLFDHLRGKNGVAETLNWGTRVQVVLEAAQGLDYLHKGCNLPIIHRDVKTSNILLGRNLEAKIADFGLCKTYLSDSQSHISATAAGSLGYIDPEYYHTGRLTESSDVYSFGVVLLEVATGKPPIVPGHGHIVQHVNQMITVGDDISSIADVLLGGAYDVNSMWKVVDTAMKCMSDTAAQRPTMAAVVAHLKESLALEEAREKDSSVRATLGGDVSALLSTYGPSAR